MSASWMVQGVDGWTDGWMDGLMEDQEVGERQVPKTSPAPWAHSEGARIVVTCGDCHWGGAQGPRCLRSAFLGPSPITRL